MTEKNEIFSPNKNYKLKFFDSIEPRMGLNMSKFSLTDMQTDREINFPPLFAVGYSGHATSWSENSNYFMVPIGHPSECLFIFEISNRQFASIHFSNVWVINAHFNFERIEIEFEDSQIPERNEHNRYPTKQFLKPSKLTFKLSELNWVHDKHLKQFSELNKKTAVIDLKPIDNGWRQFKGQLPQTTDILVWDLNQFAEYGDKQSQEWFEEIKSKTKDINYWAKATQYLGVKTRN